MKRILVPALLFYLALAKTFVFAETQNVAVYAKADVQTILELKIEQTGQSELRFGNIQPSAIQATEAGPVTVILHVTSNIGESYQITQSISSALENAEGNQISLDNLKYKTTSLNATGTAVAALTSVTKSPQTIFVSDAKSASDTIKAEYTLTVPASQAPGDYSALLTYTVSSL